MYHSPSPNGVSHSLSNFARACLRANRRVTQAFPFQRQAIEIADHAYDRLNANGIDVDRLAAACRMGPDERVKKDAVPIDLRRSPASCGSFRSLTGLWWMWRAIRPTMRRCIGSGSA